MMQIEMRFCPFYLPTLLFALHMGGDITFGGGFRTDTSRQQIFESSFASSSPAYEQTIHLVPLWEMKGKLAGFIERFRLEWEGSFAPFRRGWESIHDFERSLGPTALEATFHLRPKGYVLETLGTLFYRYPIVSSFAIVPLAGYIYDLLKIHRKHVNPVPFVFPNGVESFPDFSKEVDETWGPFIGVSLSFQWNRLWALDGGYRYQILGYQSSYENHLHIEASGLLDQQVTVHRFIHTSHAFAHEGLLQFSYHPTAYLQIVLGGRATYRYVNRRKCAETNLVINQTEPTLSLTDVNMLDGAKIDWKTLSADLLLSYQF